jgi:lysophospholipase L1-like esterase
VGCADPEPDPLPEDSRVVPSSGPCSGYYRVSIDVAQIGVLPEHVLEVRFGGVIAYGPAPTDAGRLEATLQGHPDCGPVNVTLLTPGGEHTLEGAFEYVPPESPHFDRIVGLGASLGQGVQRGVPSAHGVLMSPLAQLARQAGGYMSLPMLVEPLFPQIAPKDIGAPPGCEIPDVETFVATQMIGSISELTDPETGAFAFYVMRVDPDIEVLNVAVGGAKVVHLLAGLPPDDLGANFLGHMVYDPYGEILGPIDETPIERVEALSPTLIVSADLYGNDVLRPLLNDPDPMAPEELEEIATALEGVLDRLVATGAQVFILNLPDPSLLPAAQEHLRTVADEDLADVEAFIASLQQAAFHLNAIAESWGLAHDNLHIVDLVGPAAEVAASGLDVGGESFGIRRFGGLVGLDGIHFTDTGYAYLANLLVASINEALGTSVPAIDLAAVAANDPETPSALAAQGLDGTLCE